MSSKLAQLFFSLLAILLLGLQSSYAVEAAKSAAKSDIAAKSEIISELVYRVSSGRAEDVTILIKQGASPNANNQEGLPLLLVAAGRKDSEAANVVQALVEGGADINTRDQKNQTALFYAARNGNDKLVEYLLNRRIDYYAIDNNGDIARTLAFRAGHANLVTIMDEFVKSQTLRLESLKEQSQLAIKQQNDLQKQTEEEIQKKAVQKAKEREKENAKLKAYYDWQFEQMKKKQAEEYAVKMEKLKGKVSDLSYNSCSFQYWSFCRDVKQTTPLLPEALAETIEIHHGNIMEISKEIMKIFAVGPDYVTKIIDFSEIWIFNELNAMPSRTYRKELGVCKIEDAEKRCHEISKNWEISPGKVNHPPPAKVKNQNPTNKANPVKNNKNQLYPGGIMHQKTGRAARQ